MLFLWIALWFISNILLFIFHAYYWTNTTFYYAPNWLHPYHFRLHCKIVERIRVGINHKLENILYTENDPFKLVISSYNKKLINKFLFKNVCRDTLFNDLRFDASYIDTNQYWCFIRINVWYDPYVHTEKSYQIKPKADCIYHFPVDLATNGRPIGAFANRCLANTILFRFGLIRFRKDFYVFSEYIQWNLYTRWTLTDNTE